MVDYCRGFRFVEGCPSASPASTARPSAARAARNSPSGSAATAVSAAAATQAGIGGGGAAAGGATVVVWTKRRPLHRRAAKMGVDPADQLRRVVLQLHRHRAGAGDGERAGGQAARRADRGQHRADDRLPVGHDLARRPGSSPRNAGRATRGSQRTQRPRAVDAPVGSIAIPGFVLSSSAIASAESLLRWYDRHRRRLPWRALPGKVPDPYHVWLSEIMLQQTTVAAVIPYYERFVTRFPTVADAGRGAAGRRALRLGGARLLRARPQPARLRAGRRRRPAGFPRDLTGLGALPGIGDYTARAVGAIAFDVPAVPVDGNVERVVARLVRGDRAIAAAPSQRCGALADRLGADPDAAARPGDFAQALFDLGATVCTPAAPACALCPWMADCAGRHAGIAAELPRRAEKPPRPLRHGVHFWLEDAGGNVLLRRRPEAGLLGGMAELPGTDWRAAPWRSDEALALAPMPAAWRPAGQVRHGFTHFALTIELFAARVEKVVADGFLYPVRDLHAAALPSVMRKCVAMAAGEQAAAPAQTDRKQPSVGRVDSPRYGKRL